MHIDFQPLAFEEPIIKILNEIEKNKQLFQEKKIDEQKFLKTQQQLNEDLKKNKRKIYSNLNPWQKVQISRHPARPYFLDYINNCFDNFIELHGDRRIGDDKAMPGGLAKINKNKCIVIGHQKGRDTKENLKRNFGSANPEGYRKALRLMKMAEKFTMPVISFIDTPGAYPGIGAEERNIAEAIALNLKEMFLLKTPIISIIIGEGGSGGALGIAVSDRVYILQNAYYSVISPEGCAAILWKNRKYAPQAAKALKITARELKKLQIADEIIKEPVGGAHFNPEQCTKNIKKTILKAIKELNAIPRQEMLKQRYQRFRKFGNFD